MPYPLWTIAIMGFCGVAMGFHGLDAVIGSKCLEYRAKRNVWMNDPQLGPPVDNSVIEVAGDVGKPSGST